MAIPTYDQLMLPVLALCGQKNWTMRDLISRISDDLGLTVEERQQLLPSGSISLIANRVHWAKTYLKKAGLLAQPKRGEVEITERGRKVLAEAPKTIDLKLLQQFEEFQSFLHKAENGHSSEPAPAPAPLEVSAGTRTPQELIATAEKELEASLRDDLLTRVLEASPQFFERLIIDLLTAMGYGGAGSNAGEHLGGTGDGGIDGIIREDRLGLDRIYLQAKRYKPGNTVGSEAVRSFKGALLEKGAHKGVLITTSSFSKSANEAAGQSGSLRLVLVDGDQLTKLMVTFNVGVRVARRVEIKSVDLDYFADQESE